MIRESFLTLIRRLELTTSCLFEESQTEVDRHVKNNRDLQGSEECLIRYHEDDEC